MAADGHLALFNTFPTVDYDWKNCLKFEATVNEIL